MISVQCNVHGYKLLFRILQDYRIIVVYRINVFSQLVMMEGVIAQRPIFFIGNASNLNQDIIGPKLSVDL